MTLLIDVFPVIVLIGLVVAVVALWRLAKRYSLGSVEGGAWEFELPEPPGQRQVPWELEQVNRQLALSGEGSPLVPLLNQMIQASPLDSNQYLLGANASRSQIERVVADLEKAIGMRNG